MLYRFISGFLFSLLIASSSCTRTPPVVVSDPFKEVTNAYLFVLADITFQTCGAAGCITERGKSSGTGFIIATNGTDSFGVTAGHLCLPSSGASVLKQKMRVYLYGGVTYSAEVFLVHEDQDVCVIRIKGLIKNGLSVGDRPNRGDKVYTASSPFGIYDAKMVPLFDGYYSGRKSLPKGDLELRKDTYTIPSAPGSSGAPIINKDGKLVGMTIIKFRGFEHLCLSPPYEFLRDVINGIKNDIWARKL